MGRIKIPEVKENDREARIQQAIQERTTKGTNLRDLAILYNVPRSTLSDRLRGIPPRHEAQKKQQALSPATERSLVRWIDDMDASGFPPRLNLFKAVAARLVLDDGGPPLGITWLRRFLNRHPEHSTKFSSGLNRQCALSSKPEPIEGYFRNCRPSSKSTSFSLIIYTIVSPVTHKIWVRKAPSLGCLIEQSHC